MSTPVSVKITTLPPNRHYLPLANRTKAVETTCHFISKRTVVIENQCLGSDYNLFIHTKELFIHTKELFIHHGKVVR
jgi:hypothetical protein